MLSTLCELLAIHPICLSACVCLPVCLPACLPVCLSVFMSACLPVCLSVGSSPLAEWWFVSTATPHRIITGLESGSIKVGQIKLGRDEIWNHTVKHRLSFTGQCNSLPSPRTVIQHRPAFVLECMCVGRGIFLVQGTLVVSYFHLSHRRLIR